MNNEYDILIIGGGMVGASLAHALSGRGVRIGVVEAHPLDSRAQPSYDDRVIALAYGTRRILSGVGVWTQIAADAEPIRRIHISDRGRCGFTRLDHADVGVEALGYVATARVLGQSLLKGLESAADVELLCPGQLESFETRDDRVSVEAKVNGEREFLTCRLLVAADGGRSLVRQLLGLKTRHWTYGQTAVIANITPGTEHRGVAYERFTDSGPLAMLPMTEGRCSLVWTLADGQVGDVMGLDDRRFLQRLQARFGYRLGRLQKVGARSAYPLRHMLIKDKVRPRVVLIGNAAHTLHPVAGQGFNLGMRDVAVLAERVGEAARAGADPGSRELLQRYADSRRGDQQAVSLITDGLVRLFTNPLAPVSLARNLGLLGLDMAPGAKRLVARRFMGLSGRLPRLARGLSLG
jgi:2-octaprenyl-6-methoxyphenol hydroxylase